MILLEIGSSWNSFGQLVSVLCIFILVLGLTYLTTRWIAGYQKVHTYNHNLRIIETLKITQNKYIQIVEAGEKYLVVAICKDTMTLLTTLEKEELKDLNLAEAQDLKTVNESFQDLLDKVKEHIPKK